MNRFVIIFAVLAAMVAALAVAAPTSPPRPFDVHLFTREPGSPTRRHTIKDAGGQQVDSSHNVGTGQITSGWLALGKNTHESTSPKRQGQPSTGGEASTSQKRKKKGRGK